jgi:diguanylate cyclase (GGDEF)-like protein/PAS domain S-box-containing protein
VNLARDNSDFVTDASQPGTSAVPASDALTAEIVHDLLASPDASRAALFAALQESTRQFESLLSCVSGTFYRCGLSPPWQMEFISSGIEAISGYEPEAFVRMPFGALIVPDDMPELKRCVEAAIARREHFSTCYRIRHKSGEIRWVSERGAAVHDAQGRPQFLEGFIADVTAAKSLEIEAEAARAEVEKVNSRMRRILEFTLEGIVSFDADWNYRFVNKTGSRDVAPGESLLGRNLHDAYPGFRETSAWPVMQRVMEKREAVRTECFVAAADKWFEIYAVPDSKGVTAFFRDISDRKWLEETLVGQAEDLRATLDSIPDMVWTAHPDGRGDYYNSSWNDFIGRTAGHDTEYGRTPTGDWIHPDDTERCFAEWRRALDSGEPFEVEYRMRHHSGEFRWLVARSWPRRNERGEIVKWCGAAFDIHERVIAERRLRESRNLQSNLLEASSDCIEITDLKGNLLFVNSAGLAARGGMDRASAIGRPWAEHWPEANLPTARRTFSQAQKGKTVRLVESSATERGRKVWWDIIVSPIRNTEGVICNVLSIARDITDQRATSERLRNASEQGVLTALPNRRAFGRHLKKVTTRARDTGINIGLMLLDLDHFKHVNDTLGHLAGDHLLKVIGRRLKRCVKDAGFVARLGGDEFAIVFNDIHDESELVSAATQILAQMEAPVTFAGQMINGGLSIGCAMYPRDARDAQSLLQHTDTALYDLKASGRGGIQMFNRRMMEAAERTANQLALARTAIRDDAVEPYYQPKVRLDSGQISGFEALLRWWSPGNGIQPPSSVAEAFNDYELSTKIGGLMQSRIFADMAGWLQQGLTLPPVSINAAPAEFLRDDYAERLLDRLGEYHISPALIEVEITEHVFLERRTEQVIRALELLKQAGARIALDDFGTGHSSLAHLRDFPVDVLKIDRSFVSRMLSKPRMLAIVQAITKLGPSLSLDIVAEGVETPEQLHALRDAGCEFGQGYLFGKAMHAAEVGRRLATENWPFKQQAVG